MSYSHWLNWCRLCAKDDVGGNVKVYTNADKWGQWDNVLVMAIRRYFEVHMRLEDDLSSVLCTECYTLISELIDFSEHVTKVQAIFEILRRNETEPGKPLDVTALRQQYGLGADDWTHIIKPMPGLSLIENQEDEKPTSQLDETKQEFIDLGDRQIGKDMDEDSRAHSQIEEFEDVLLAGPTTLNRSDEYSPGKDDIKSEIEDKPKYLESFSSVDKDDDHEKDDKEMVQMELDKDQGKMSTKRCLMECRNCGKSYRNRGSYEKHLEQLCHRLDRKPPNKIDRKIACDICHKVLSSAAALKLHKEGIHDNAKPFICDSCGKQLKTITALNEHKLVHTEDRPFQCDVCQAGFKNKARLKIHHQIHEEPHFECDICGKRLQTRRTWNMHKVVHNEERKLKCEVCGALFKRSKTLKTHLLSHTGLRPYVCQYCGKTFACNANCRSHKLKKHPKEVALEEGEGLSARLSVPTLEELRVMTQKIPKDAS
ncbi:zinc finger protein weckle [Drosophila tropicalis]|uniref:zinc finger protein weckle n=1 Tax=Drosophila tropicalis TaxID=46794 RepID=UPI0035AB7446